MGVTGAGSVSDGSFGIFVMVTTSMGVVMGVVIGGSSGRGHVVAKRVCVGDVTVVTTGTVWKVVKRLVRTP